jgi:coenzyme PQQ biosynthesis protein PqqD
VARNGGFPEKQMSHTETRHLIPIANHSLSVNAAGGTFTITDSHTGDVFVVNDVARRIMQLCDGGRTVVEISRLLAEEFPAAPQSRIAEDVDYFLAKAFQKNLIRWAERPE